MLLQLDQARNGPLRWQDAIAVPAADLLRDQALILGNVECEGSLTFTGPDFLLETRLRYRHRLHCDRCLTAFKEDVELPLMFVVTVHGGAAPANGTGSVDEHGGRELAPEDLSTLTAVDGAFDLGSLVREQVELNVPMKPICKASCSGLCPQCGADRNREACACSADRVDPRWSGLEAIRERVGR